MEYLKISTNFSEVIEALSDAEKGRLFLAMLSYADTGEEPDLQGNERILWPVARRDIRQSVQKIETLRSNARSSKEKQSEANESKAEQREANESKAEQREATENKEREKERERENENGKEKVAQKEKDKDKEIEREKEKEIYQKETLLTECKEKGKRFSPPSVEEVEEYCRERRNSVDPNVFVDFYASKGWKVGKEPMKDWKACVRTWERNRNGPTKKVIAQDFDQRDYSDVDQDLMSSLAAEMALFKEGRL